jgi:OOP family OmpA-OmpF porin
MNLPHKCYAATFVVLCASSLAQAQTSTSSTDPVSPGASNTRSDYSLLPGTRRGYVGLNIGKPEYKTGCGNALAGTCADPDARLHLYTGGLMGDWVGVELGYINEGSAARGGGNTRAQGVNLSLVLRAPIGQFNAFAKGGATYGRTRVTAAPLTGIAEGKASGWGRSYGLGVGFDFTPTSGIVLEWSRNRYHFPGDVRQDVDATSLGYVHRF